MQVAEHVLPALMKVHGGRLPSDVMVLNFGLHFNSKIRAQQYIFHIDSVAKFFGQHKVCVAAQTVHPVVL